MVDSKNLTIPITVEFDAAAIFTTHVSGPRGDDGEWDQFNPLREEIVGSAAAILAREIKPLVMDAIKEKVHDYIAVIIDAVLRDDAQKFDEWGSPMGEPVNLRKLLADEVARQVKPSTNRSYGSDSAYDKVAKEIAKSVLERELRDVVTAAKADLLATMRSEGAQVLAETLERVRQGR